MLTNRFITTVLAATTALLISSPVLADEEDGYLHPSWWSPEVWAGVSDGQFANVFFDGEELRPRFNIWILDERWWNEFDTDTYVCILSLTTTSSPGTSDPDAWLDWSVQLEPADIWTPACDNLDPVWAEKYLSSVPRWVTEVTVEALAPETADMYASMWGDAWNPIADLAVGGDMYDMGESMNMI